MDPGRLEIARTALGWMMDNPDIAYGAVKKGIKKYVSGHEEQKGALYLEIGKAALAIGEDEENISRLVRIYELTKGANAGTHEATQHAKTRDEIIEVVDKILKKMSNQKQCRLAVNDGIRNYLRAHGSEGGELLVEIANIARKQQDKETEGIQELFQRLKIDQSEETPVTSIKKIKTKSPMEAQINVSNEDIDKIPKELGNVFFESPEEMKKMYVEYLGKPSAEGIVDLIRKDIDLGSLSEVEELDLSNLDIYTRKEFIKIITTCKNLKSLALPKAADEWWLREVVKNCPHLQSLSIGGGAQHIFTDLDLLKDLKALTSLSIISQSELKNIDFLEHLKGLVNLNLSGCRFSKFEYGIYNLDIFNRLPALRNLNLSNTSFRRDECVKSLVNLESLDFSGCDGMHDLRYVGNCAALKSLNLSNCKDIRDISAIGNCRALENLNLSGCESLIDFSVIEKLPNLKGTKLS